MNKKIISLLLAILFMCVSLSACSASSYNSGSEESYEEETVNIYDYCIPTYEALDHVGEEVNVIGEVISWASPEIAGDPLFINLDADYPDENRLQLVLWDDIRYEYVDNLGEMLQGKTIVVHGVVENYDGIAQITIDEDSFIVEKDEFLEEVANIDENINENISQNEVEDKKNKVLFDKNDGINYFLVIYQALIKHEFTNINSDNDDVCYAENSGYFFEVRDLGDDLQVIIKPTSDTADDGVEYMDEVYHFAVATLTNIDNELTIDEEGDIFVDNEINKEINDLIISVYPDTDYDSGYIDITRKNYKDKYYEMFLKEK